MCKYLFNFFAAILTLCVTAPALAEDFWQRLQSYEPYLLASDYGSSYALDLSALEAKLQNGNAELDIPLPDGKLVQYRFQSTSVMAEELALKYPELRTFVAYDTQNPRNSGRFDITPAGFHGMFLHDGEMVVIDPKPNAGAEYGAYQTYYAKDMLNGAERPIDRVIRDLPTQQDSIIARKTVVPGVTKYRLAVSAAAEYTLFHGGTKAAGLGAIVTLVNRMNQVFVPDLGIEFELVANNDAVIFTNRNTDPFRNTDEDLDVNTSVLDEYIGSANYDIGHVLNTNGGGLAGLGSVCSAGAKGDGMTGSQRPTGDAFYINLVAHEIGHQFGAEHSFNGLEFGCEGNRVAGSAWEPGSGVTIMSYAGLCRSQNLDTDSIPYFHIGSIEEIRLVLQGKSCGQSVPLAGQLAPVVEAGQNYTVPMRTPLKLVGSASDANGDTLTYSWEQLDIGSPTNSAETMVDDGTRPLFRSWPVRASADRFLPRLQDVLAGTTTLGETYATTTRVMNFRLTVRDGQAVASDDMTVSVNSDSGPFEVSEPAAGSEWTSGLQAMVEWDVANTDLAPVSCEAVDILLSTDGGAVFSDVLLSDTENDGAAFVLSDEVSSNARVMVRCSDNIFFAVNAASFEILPGTAAETVPRITGHRALTVVEGSTLTIQPSDLIISDSDTVDLQNFSITIGAGSNYTVQGATVIPAANFSGTLDIPVTVSDGVSESATFNISVDVSGVNDEPTAVNDQIQFAQGVSQRFINVLANDTDPDGDVLRIIAIAYTGSSTVSIQTNTIAYAPLSSFTGTETIEYTLRDPAGARSTATLTVTVNASTSTGAGGGSNGSSSSGGGGGGGALTPWLLLVLLSLSLVACAKPPGKPQSDEIAEKSEPAAGEIGMESRSYTWVENMPAEDAVKQAIARDDFRLLQTNSRQPYLPGVQDDDSAIELSQRCGTRILLVGDVLRSEEQKQQRKALIAHAEDYNKRMLAFCKQGMLR